MLFRARRLKRLINLKQRFVSSRVRRLELGFGESNVAFQLTLDTTSKEDANIPPSQDVSVASVVVAGLTAVTLAPVSGRLFDLGGIPADLSPLTVAGWPATTLRGIGDINENLPINAQLIRSLARSLVM